MDDGLGRRIFDDQVVSIKVGCAARVAQLAKALLVNVGMMWPTLACVVGKAGRARQAEAVEVCVSPAAVRIVVGGAVVSRWVTGADGMK